MRDAPRDELAIASAEPIEQVGGGQQRRVGPGGVGVASAVQQLSGVGDGVRQAGAPAARRRRARTVTVADGPANPLAAVGARRRPRTARGDAV